MNKFVYYIILLVPLCITVAVHQNLQGGETPPRLTQADDPHGYDGITWKMAMTSVETQLKTKGYEISKPENSIISARKKERDLIFEFGPTKDQINDDYRNYNPTFEGKLWRVKIPLFKCSADQHFNQDIYNAVLSKINSKYGQPLRANIWKISETYIQLDFQKNYLNCQSLYLIYFTSEYEQELIRNRDKMARDFIKNWNISTHSFLKIEVGNTWDQARIILDSQNLEYQTELTRDGLAKVTVNEFQFAKKQLSGRLIIHYVPMQYARTEYSNWKGKILSIEFQTGYLVFPQNRDEVNSFLTPIIGGKLEAVDNTSTPLDKNTCKTMVRYIPEDNWLSVKVQLIIRDPIKTQQELDQETSEPIVSEKEVIIAEILEWIK